MENSLYCIFYKTIDFSGGNFSIVTTKEISNTEGALFQKLKSESEKLIILNFKALVDKDTDSITRQVCVFEKDFSGIEFLVNIHVINRTPEKLYLCEVYIENTIYLKEVFEHLIHSRIISFVIYNFDNILFADKGFTCLTEYSEDELKNMDFSSFFNESFKEVIKNISDKRSKGFNINQEFHHLPIYTKSGYFKYVNAYDTTISYLGQNVGCMFIVDVSEEVSSKDLYSILYNLNSLIRKRIVSLEEFFNFLCSEIVKDKNISFAWVGKI
jgi:PAS domain S-box-containing protein